MNNTTIKTSTEAITIKDFKNNLLFKDYSKKIEEKFYSEKIKDKYEIKNIEEVFNMDKMKETRAHNFQKCEKEILKGKNNHIFSEKLLGHMEYTINFFNEIDTLYEIVEKLLKIIYDMESAKNLNLRKDEKDLFEKHFKNTLANLIYYHDFGKASLNFNKFAMKIANSSKDLSIYEKHSFMVMFFASSYLKDIITEIEEKRHEFKDFYNYFIYLLIDMTIKHHDENISKKEITEEFTSKNEVNKVRCLYDQRGYELFVNESFLTKGKNLSIIENLKTIGRDHFLKIKKNKYDLNKLFLLRKLLHSLITCCDGYATYQIDKLDGIILKEIKEGNKICTNIENYIDLENISNFSKLNKVDVKISSLKNCLSYLDYKDNFFKVFINSDKLNTDSPDINKVKVIIEHKFMNSLLERNKYIVVFREKFINKLIGEKISNSNKMIFLINSVLILDEDTYEKNKEYLDLFCTVKNNSELLENLRQNNKDYSEIKEIFNCNLIIK